MDMLIVNIIVVSVFVTGLVICLEVVSFGRVATVSAALALLSGATSVICLQFNPLNWDKPIGTLAEVDRTFVQTGHALFVIDAAIAIAIFFAGVFCVSGSLRVWSRRSVLISRFISRHFSSVPSLNSIHTSKRDRILAVLAALVFIVLVGWELYDFIVPNRGLQFYKEHIHMLLYPMGAATLVGVVLALFSRFARRHATRTDSQSSPEQDT